MKIFEAYTIKNMCLKNRIVMPPMCMYSSDNTGNINDFHLVHYTTRSIGGVGFIIVEATGITPNGRISDKDLGIWSEKHAEGLSFLVKEVKKYGSKIAIQLNHSGRKYEGTSGEPVAPSALAFDENSKTPKELTKNEIKEIILAFKAAAKRAEKAGFDAIEIHGAHGYLINQFLSPLSNFRDDEYGGSTENRTRFLKEVLEAVREVWPKEKPILLRVSAEDYRGGSGITPNEMVNIINIVKDLIDVVDVSSGGVAPAHINLYPGYQVKLSEVIKNECNVPTIAVGLICDINMVEEILSNNRADLVALGRELLRNPYFVLSSARLKNINIDFPKPYERAFN
ncbi:NADPH2 dehydrogenase [Clostridium acetobutylicum]|uniref:NADPH dehydrogenase n=1 Tax=Clostridium acetobutylicum (strain ATCC 824 / DSM 792 / JCM 1419 / IAM 19013 / LMG 5710 / NBRC 13948 / NRRL B-527 / VKM B-1787 / 2291 / W) TaxID=272562 RepID=NAMA_CLOAB|nr:MULTISPECIES: NADPH dehydrogenase NamA [Clostridium]Q97E86.1 RecName: Full=NADPH dehydrogenase [Clostridium acetobutylicum ATCC 824]AAK81164.1 NADH:flavin oxidoreductases, Old Yellow Enzyme family [Clostridium acetobutylicum ATCC 824]ADZ22269.1 NADH:flavin oxidoreductase, Old Yellow Enzyme family [Clostridium acetobutylicum EA 2018]AEI34158.1 NADPH dehydrogenase NamA [Clostridium acetobutylicum DSM 1731]AWV81168.1 NADPH dehydrogenase NamA [Clostridium acetobutylicum]MBC2395630.1 NADPH dehy